MTRLGVPLRILNTQINSVCLGPRTKCRKSVVSVTCALSPGSNNRFDKREGTLTEGKFNAGRCMKPPSPTGHFAQSMVS